MIVILTITKGLSFFWQKFMQAWKLGNGSESCDISRSCKNIKFVIFMVNTAILGTPIYMWPFLSYSLWKWKDGKDDTNIQMDSLAI